MAEGGMIGAAVELAVPGENNWEVCADATPLLAQSNTRHSAAQRRRNEIIADVAGILAGMRTRFSTQIGAISSRLRPVCNANGAMLGAFRPLRIENARRH
jgi:hypothetical protein